jgi:hypothetical protein
MKALEDYSTEMFRKYSAGGRKILPPEDVLTVRTREGKIEEITALQLKGTNYPLRSTKDRCWTIRGNYWVNEMCDENDIIEIIKRGKERTIKTLQQQLQAVVEEISSGRDDLFDVPDNQQRKVRLRNGSVVRIVALHRSHWQQIKAGRWWYSSDGSVDGSDDDCGNTIVELIEKETEMKTVEQFFRQYEKTGKVWENGLEVTLRNGETAEVHTIIPKKFNERFPIRGPHDSYKLSGRVGFIEPAPTDIVAIPSEGIFPDTAASVLQSLVSLIKGDGYVSVGVKTDPLAPLLDRAEQVLQRRE